MKIITELGEPGTNVIDNDNFSKFQKFTEIDLPQGIQQEFTCGNTSEQIGKKERIG